MNFPEFGGAKPRLVWPPLEFEHQLSLDHPLLLWGLLSCQSWSLTFCLIDNIAWSGSSKVQGKDIWNSPSPDKALYGSQRDQP